MRTDKTGTRKVRPFWIWPLSLLTLILAAGGFYGGVSFLADPVGSPMGMSTSLLEGTPVSTYTLPGLFLLLAMGLLPVLALYGLWAKPRWAWTDFLNRWTGRHWSWTATVGASLLLLAWLIYEAVSIGYFALQGILGGIGLAMLLLALLPSVRNYYRLE